MKSRNILYEKYHRTRKISIISTHKLRCANDFSKILREDLRIYSKAQTARKSSEHPLKCPILIQLQFEWEPKVSKATHGVHIYKI